MRSRVEAQLANHRGERALERGDCGQTRRRKRIHRTGVLICTYMYETVWTVSSFTLKFRVPVHAPRGTGALFWRVFRYRLISPPGTTRFGQRNNLRLRECGLPTATMASATARVSDASTFKVARWLSAGADPIAPLKTATSTSSTTAAAGTSGITTLKLLWPSDGAEPVPAASTVGIAASPVGIGATFVDRVGGAEAPASADGSREAAKIVQTMIMDEDADTGGPGTVVVHVRHATGLMAGDRSGTSNPHLWSRAGSPMELTTDPVQSARQRDTLAHALPSTSATLLSDFERSVYRVGGAEAFADEVASTAREWQATGRLTPAVISETGRVAGDNTASEKIPASPLPACGASISTDKPEAPASGPSDISYGVLPQNTTVLALC